MTYAMETRGLTKTLGQRPLLANLDLQIAPGECVAVHGANGAGKTTLLRCLANLARPTAGHVIWFGTPVAAGRARQSLVGYLAHESFLYLELTAAENLMLAARLYGVAEPQRRVPLWLERLGCRDVEREPVQRLSQGTRQRLSLARALLHDPPLLVLDEPFSNLDERGQQQLTVLFAEWKAAGRTVCFTGHDRQVSARVADRVLSLHGGRWQPSAARS